MITRTAATILLLALAALPSPPPASAFVPPRPAALSSSVGRPTTFAPPLSVHAGQDADMSPEERAAAVERATRSMTAFSNKYIANTDTKYCSDLSIPAVVIKGLAEHKVSLGAPLCPCRYYEDKEKEARDGYWNCPCVPMRERHECHCMLFLTEDNAFVGDKTEITYDEVVDLSGGVSM